MKLKITAIFVFLLISSSAIASSKYATALTGCYAFNDWKVYEKVLKIHSTSDDLQLEDPQILENFLNREIAKSNVIRLQYGEKIEVMGHLTKENDTISIAKIKVNNKIYYIHANYIKKLSEPLDAKKFTVSNKMIIPVS